MTLFANQNTLKLPDAEIQYFERFYSKPQADEYFELLKGSIDWQSYKIKVYGKIYNQPRLTAFYNESPNDYGYSNIKLNSLDMIPPLKSIRNRINERTGLHFNSVLLNYYRDGNDSNGWHADNEKVLGENPIIASLSLGEERAFSIKHNNIATERYKLFLGHGSLLIMKGKMQHHWKHQLPKSKKNIGERINLTFRQL